MDVNDSSTRLQGKPVKAMQVHGQIAFAVTCTRALAFALHSTDLQYLTLSLRCACVYAALNSNYVSLSNSNVSVTASALLRYLFGGNTTL